MFADKIAKMKEQQEVYLKTVTGYHDLIEALLFREQKKHFGSIEYITNRFDAIYINILNSKNIEKISLPFFDSDMSIWKSKSYSIVDIQKGPEQIINGYKIEIKKVPELEYFKNAQPDGSDAEFWSLRNDYKELLSLRNEHEEFLRLKKEHEEFLRPKKGDEDFAKLKSENSRLEQKIKNLVKSKNEELSKLKQENDEKLSRLEKEYEELVKSKDEELSRLEQEYEENLSSLREREGELAELEGENLNLKQEIKNLAKQCFIKYNIDNLIVKDDNIIHKTPFMFELPDQGDIKFTLSELIKSNYIIRKEKIELIVNSMTIENVNVEFVPDEKKFIYRYKYSNEYKNRDATFPADGKTTYELINGAEHLIHERDNYTVWVYVTLV